MCVSMQPLLILSIYTPTEPKVAGTENASTLFIRAMGLSDDVPVRIVHFPTQPIPDFSAVSGVIINGSGYSVNDSLPWIGELQKYVLHWMKNKIPMLGVDFGLQIVVKTIGGNIAKKEEWEIGPKAIMLTTEGSEDPLFFGVPREFFVQANHKEGVIALPDGKDIRELARSDRYPQAIAIGKYIRLVQFHPEIDGVTMARIIRSRKVELRKEGAMPKDAQMLERYLSSIERSDIGQFDKIILRNFANHFLRIGS